MSDFMTLTPHIFDNGEPGVKLTICNSEGLIDLFYKEHDAIKLAQGITQTVRVARLEAQKRKQK